MLAEMLLSKRLWKSLGGRRVMSDRVGRSTPEKEKTAGASPRTAEEIADWLVSHLAELLELNPDAIDVQEPLSNYWLGSLQGIGLVGDLEQWLDLPLSQTILYEPPKLLAPAATLGGTK